LYENDSFCWYLQLFTSIFFHSKSFWSSNIDTNVSSLDNISLKTYFLHMNPDGDKSYTKIAAFVESYNFIIQTFCHFKSFWCSNNNIFRCKTWRTFSSRSFLSQFIYWRQHKAIIIFMKLKVWTKFKNFINYFLFEGFSRVGNQ
jgi:hypothetical protein